MKHTDPVQRVQASFMSFHERRVLRAFATFLPGWVTPDRLTAFGVLGAVLILVGYWLSFQSVQWLWLANFGILVNWFGDSMDGTIARYRRIERSNYGYYLDQTTDTVSNLLIALGVGLSPYFRLDIALIALAAYHMLSIHVFVRSVLTQKFTVDVAGLGPTEMRVGILAVNLGVLVFGATTHSLFGISYTWCDLFALSTVGLMLVIFATEVRKEAARQLARDLRTTIEE